MHQWQVSLAYLKLKACIIIILKVESMLNVSSLNILKYSIIAFGDMQNMPASSKLTWIAPIPQNTLGVLRLVNYVVVLTVLFHILTMF